MSPDFIYQYHLYAGTTLVETKPGTGSSLTWSVETEENTIYTVKAENLENGCILNMTGSAAVFIGPITTAGTVLAACPGSNIQIPVTVTDFAGVGAISLTLNYDASVLNYVSCIEIDTVGISFQQFCNWINWNIHGGKISESFGPTFVNTRWSNIILINI